MKCKNCLGKVSKSINISKLGISYIYKCNNCNKIFKIIEEEA